MRAWLRSHDRKPGRRARPSPVSKRGLEMSARSFQGNTMGSCERKRPGSCCWPQAKAGAQTAGDPNPQAGVPSTSLSEVVVTATRRGEQNVAEYPAGRRNRSPAGLSSNTTSSRSMISGRSTRPCQCSTSARCNSRSSSAASRPTPAQTTGVYLDEAPLQGGFNSDIFGDNTPGLRLHDVDHIEVLKGPQGTLFGAGSMDGTCAWSPSSPSSTRSRA